MTSATNSNVAVTISAPSIPAAVGGGSAVNMVSASVPSAVNPSSIAYTGGSALPPAVIVPLPAGFGEPGASIVKSGYPSLKNAFSGFSTSEIVASAVGLVTVACLGWYWYERK